MRCILKVFWYTGILIISFQILNTYSYISSIYDIIAVLLSITNYFGIIRARVCPPRNDVNDPGLRSSSHVCGPSSCQQ